MISKNDYIKKLVIDAFKTPIFNIQTTINTQSLIDYAYELKNKSKGRVISNVSGWQSEELDKDLPIFNELKNTINKFAQDLHEYIDLKKDSLNILDNIWFNINYKGRPECHDIQQLEGSPLVEKNKNLTFHKILNPWIIKTPPGYSTLFVPPLNNADDRFSIIPGIVDTDSFENEINFPIVINGDKYEILDTILERGTPYVQCIPFKRESWKMQIKVIETNKYLENRFFMVKHLIHNYKKLFWKKKSWK